MGRDPLCPVNKPQLYQGSEIPDGADSLDCQQGAAVVKLGLLLDYPRGEPDEVWICPSGKRAVGIS